MIWRVMANVELCRNDYSIYPVSVYIGSGDKAIVHLGRGGVELARW